MLIADPRQTQKLFPEIFGEIKDSSVDEVIDTMDEDTEIDYALEAPSSEEAMRVADLLGDQSGILNLG